MKQTFNLIFKILLAFCLASLPQVGYASADNIRKPAFAGSFYPAQRSELTSFIEQLTSRVKSTKVQHPPQTSLKALIMPHAGYIYSGLTAAHASLVLKEEQFAKIIVLAPDHRIGFKGGAVSDVKAYETPLGLIRLHDDAARLRRQSNLFRAIPAADQHEHSLEVVLPFLQHYLKEFALIPIVLGPGNIDHYAAALDPLLDRNTLLVASSDLSHYLSYQEAVARDQQTIQMILDLAPGKLISFFQTERHAKGPSIERERGVQMGIPPKYHCRKVAARLGRVAGLLEGLFNCFLVCFYGADVVG